MISRQHRFRGQKDIEHIYRKGRTVRTGFMGAKILTSKNQDYRLAVVVSRKVHKSAVVRNRIRRRLYENFRLIRKTGGKPICYDIVLSVYDNKILELTPADLNQACEKLIRQTEQPGSQRP